MWSVISSELALLQFEGLRSVGKTSARVKRGNVYLSPLVGHDFSFDPSAEQLQDHLASSPSREVTISASKAPGEVREHLTEAHKRTHTRTQAGAGGIKINLNAAATFVDFS